MLSFFRRIFGSAQERALAKYKSRLKKVQTRFEYLSALSNEDWFNVLQGFKDKVKLNNSVKQESEVVEGAALVKSAAFRIKGKQIIVMGHVDVWNMVHFDEQIIAGMALYDGSVSEMQTGEGKTLAAVLPLFLHSIDKPAFCITVNDYLAQRDAEWMKPLFNELRCTVDCLKNMQNLDDKRKAYSCDIVYGTASEFGFDYLREHTSVVDKASIINEKGYGFVLIDEVDQILINESKTPLIISGAAGEPSPWFLNFKDRVCAICKQNEAICEEIIQDATSVFEANRWLGGRTDKVHSNINKALDDAAKNVWVVNRSMPSNKKLLNLLEYSEIRNIVDKWEVYFSYDQNKEEMHREVQKTLVIKDERTKDFELTDAGLSTWEDEYSENDVSFKVLDLGDEIKKVYSDRSILEDEKAAAISLLHDKDLAIQEKLDCLRNLFRAFIVTKRNVDYVVDNGEIVILDESTGRLQYGRRFSNGLHQAIEAKENVSINRESQIIASITIQNFIRIFEKRSGMSGTALSHGTEFAEIYNMDVIVIPPHRASNRIDLPDKIYVTKREKLYAIVNEVKRINKEGRPILVGTYGIEESEHLSNCLRKESVSHKVLSATNHKLEAATIARAGHKNAITIATNMAGRGTDIKLDIGVNSLGGMHVIVASRGKSRAQDLQFRGRQGRQGDRGSCQFFLSFEDDILKTFQSPALAYVLKSCRPEEGEAISSPLLASAVETAQERLEHSSYQARKHALDYDEVLNVQRNQIYAFRQQLVHMSTESVVDDVLYNSCKEIVDDYLSSTRSTAWNGEHFRKNIIDKLPIAVEKDVFVKQYNTKRLILDLHSIVRKTIHSIEQDISQKINHSKLRLQFSMNRLCAHAIIGKIDDLWKEHLLNVEEIKQYVQLRSIGQKDPVHEYRKESHSAFEVLRKEFDRGVLKEVLRAAIKERSEFSFNLEKLKKAFSGKEAVLHE